MSLDRLPPHSEEAEQGILGCMLNDPNQTIDSCAANTPPEAFYLLTHQTIADAMYKMFSDRLTVDLITLGQWLRDRNLLDKVGGHGYLASLQDKAPPPGSLPHYLGIIRDKFMLRRLIATCIDSVSKAHEAHDSEAAALVDETEKAITAITVANNSQELVTIKDLVRGTVDRIQGYHQKTTKDVGIPTGFHDLDSLTGGLKGGQMVVIAARPSMGKTSLAMNIADYAGVKCGISTGVFTLEMANWELSDRLVYAGAKVNSLQAERGQLTDSDFRRLMPVAAALAKSKLHIDHAEDLTITQIRSRARRMYSQLGCRLFVIDYLQLIKGTSRRGRENRQEEVAEISRGVKSLAKELKVPVILLAQLNRDIEKDKKRKPRLSDLRESGSIEQDADVVGLLYKPSEDEDEGDCIPTNLLIAKQRNGPTGEVKLLFLKSFTRFESVSPIQHDR